MEEEEAKVEGGVLNKPVDAVATRDVLGHEAGYLQLQAGEEVRVLYVGAPASGDHGWLYGCASDVHGWFPSNAVEPVDPKLGRPSDKHEASSVTTHGTPTDGAGSRSAISDDPECGDGAVFANEPAPANKADPPSPLADAADALGLQQAELPSPEPVLVDPAQPAPPLLEPRGNDSGADGATPAASAGPVLVQAEALQPAAGSFSRYSAPCGPCRKPSPPAASQNGEQQKQQQHPQQQQQQPQQTPLPLPLPPPPPPPPPPRPAQPTPPASGGQPQRAPPKSQALPTSPADEQQSKQLEIEEETVPQAKAHAAERCNVTLLPVDEKLRGYTEVGWRYPLRDYERGCFVGHLKGAMSVRDASSWLRTVMDGVIELDWDTPVGPMGSPLPRSTKWFVAEGCSCPYRYGGITVDPTEFPSWMEELMGIVMPLCGLEDHDEWPNSCNVNLYSDGKEFIDWHADDEPLFAGMQGPCRIISLSLGATRAFELRLKRGEATASAAADSAAAGVAVANQAAAEVHSLDLRSGDICTMEGWTQRYYVHRLPRAPRPSTIRINLTWRWIVEHNRWCPAK